MEDLFQNKYCTKSIRLKDYNYSEDGYYFITICTQDKKIWFGKIKEGKMILNSIGGIIKQELLKTPKIRKNVMLDKWIIMPNHIHAIIVLNKHQNIWLYIDINPDKWQWDRNNPENI